MFKKLFNDERFRPDALMIYPTLVIKGTGIYKLWKKGSYTPCTDEEAVELLVRVKKLMPKWIRTMRIQRDIPGYLIEAGVKKGNLGELVGEKLREENTRCRCIKCRDIGHLSYKEGIEVDRDSVDILIEKYRASSGKEYFISVEDRKNDALIAYLRLRFPSETAHRQEISSQTALVRELRVLGPMVPLGRRISKYEQHRGWGGLLLKRAENIAKDADIEKILVTSAIGTREYYRRSGYRRVGAYMGKDLA
jgi:elongator complex protein 3